MAETKPNTNPTGAAPPAPLVPFRLRLGRLKSTRQTLARVIREYSLGRVPEPVFRSLVWSIGQLVSTMKTETELQTADRLAEIEKRLEALHV